MEEKITQQQFFESFEGEPDIAKIMSAYQRQFGERLTSEIYKQFMEEDEEEILVSN